MGSGSDGSGHSGSCSNLMLGQESKCEGTPPGNGTTSWDKVLEISRGSSGAKQWVIYQTLGAVTFTVKLRIRLIQFNVFLDMHVLKKYIYSVSNTFSV